MAEISDAFLMQMRGHRQHQRELAIAGNQDNNRKEKKAKEEEQSSTIVTVNQSNPLRIRLR
jgi:hypothetical protein